MPNNYFQFKQFTVKQDQCAMKVGTDGVLLGSWVKTENVKRILDIGTGTGLIALMLAQRSEAVIDALEIDEKSAGQALENIGKSPWKERINIICESFQNHSKLNFRYDLIVSNPPFFINSLHAPDAIRTTARHDDKLSFNEIIEGVVNLLIPEGKFCLIWPYSDFQLIKTISNEAGLYDNRILYIFPAPDKPIKRVMIEFSFIKKRLEESDLTIEKYGRNGYSEEYKNLTKDYYLKF
jgi:tRNA1Val (adenine37-N6)-methyltransferase